MLYIILASALVAIIIGLSVAKLAIILERKINEKIKKTEEKE